MKLKGRVKLQSKISTSNNADLPPDEPHHLFDFLNIAEKRENGLIEACGGLLPEGHGEDYQEQDFANRIKKKENRQRGQK